MVQVMELEEWLQQEVLRIYEHNSYSEYLGMEILHIRPLEARVAMKASKELMNILGGLHGGALTSLADMVMGLACATAGKRIVTLGMNVNFIYAANLDAMVIGHGQVIHNGKKVLVVEFTVLDSESQRLLAQGRGTFFVIGQIQKDGGGALAV
ncbi:MAG: PaaI family thioesterase [Peptococcaceae bacterium]|jgi:acyl-CoA thioesterase|nr:PaaI family thioesterase [Peptococcaceae bacterium]